MFGDTFHCGFNIMPSRTFAQPYRPAAGGQGILGPCFRGRRDTGSGISLQSYLCLWDGIVAGITLPASWVAFSSHVHWDHCLRPGEIHLTQADNTLPGHGLCFLWADDSPMCPQSLVPPVRKRHAAQNLRGSFPFSTISLIRAEYIGFV